MSLWDDIVHSVTGSVKSVTKDDSMYDKAMTVADDILASPPSEPEEPLNAEISEEERKKAEQLGIALGQKFVDQSLLPPQSNLPDYGGLGAGLEGMLTAFTARPRQGAVMGDVPRYTEIQKGTTKTVEDELFSPPPPENVLKGSDINPIDQASNPEKSEVAAPASANQNENPFTGAPGVPPPSAAPTPSQVNTTKPTETVLKLPNLAEELAAQAAAQAPLIAKNVSNPLVGKSPAEQLASQASGEPLIGTRTGSINPFANVGSANGTNPLGTQLSQNEIAYILQKLADQKATKTSGWF